MKMDLKKKSSEEKKDANLISQLFFIWIFPLFYKGTTKDLTIDDLSHISDENGTDNTTKTLQREWETECKEAPQRENGKPKLLHALFRSFGSRYVYFVAIFMFDGWVIRILQPIFLRLFIQSFSKNEEIKDNKESLGSNSEKCFYAAGVCVTTLIHILLNHPTAFQMCISGMKCRVAVSSLIYRKGLRLSKGAQSKCSTGHVVNLISNDASRFDYNLHFIAFFFVGPVQLLIFFCILYAELGAASIAGVGYILLLSPSQYLIGKLSAKFRVDIAAKTDDRSKIMSEIIMAMRLIKMYTWEIPFSTLIHRIRNLEIKALQKRSFLRAAFMGVFTSNFTYVPFLAILTYALLGNQVTADKAFFAVAIFNVMTEIMMYYVPNAAATIGELLASLKRIEEFLLLEEQVSQENLVVKDVSKNLNAACSVHMNQVYACWEDGKRILDKVTVDLAGNQLVMIVGPVGSGKTSFFQVLLSELRIERGMCVMEGQAAYCSQEIWIFPGTIQQNILLGRDFDIKRYNDILNACALEEDLKHFPSGDGTLVGERGMTLSGGQKARVNLARTLYQQADIYLLDDPLSSVDATTNRHIFDKCLKKYLNDRMRILVTHQLQYLPQADHIIVLSEGSVVSQGKYEDLVLQGVDFGSLLTLEAKDDIDLAESYATIHPESNLYEEIDLNSKKIDEEGKKTKDTSNSEKMEAGAVSIDTYWKYFRAGESVAGITFLILGFITTQVLISTTDYWLSFWTTVEENHQQKQLEEFNDKYFKYLNFNSTLPNNSLSVERNSYKLSTDSVEYFRRNVYLIVYAALATAVFLFDTLRTIYLFAYCMKISDNVHHKMFTSLIRAPIKFFDENSSGRIMNRFTKDIGAMDEHISGAIFDTLDIFFRMIGVLLIVIISNYVLCIPVVFLLIAYGYLRHFFVRTARNIKRIESVARSPMYTHLSSTMQGLTTIRSSKAQKTLIAQFDNYQDVHSTAWYHFIAGNNWFSIWLELTSTLFIVIVTYSFILMSNYTTSGKVGLAVASLLQLMNTFQFGMRQSAEAENMMTSVERALEYAQIEPEASLKSSRDRGPPNEWPSSGHIKFTNVSLSYDGSENVLKNLTFDIKAREKIGIVGRSGAGKSSIINALFRMCEPQGEISIDNVLTKNIGLHDLRMNISIIPQDSILFSGTIRYNLDPFNDFSDQEIWQALENVELKESIPALDFEVSESGCNFSVGQRQLICLARSLLRNNRIVVLDEATANIDRKTEHLIQETIRKNLSNCTIITIAHRLDSVMDCDRIIVMENGNIMEYDHPHILLQNPKGVLTTLANQTEKSAQVLCKLASESYRRRK